MDDETPRIHDGNCEITLVNQRNTLLAQAMPDSDTLSLAARYAEPETLDEFVLAYGAAAKKYADCIVQQMKTPIV